MPRIRPAALTVAIAASIAFVLLPALGLMALSACSLHPQDPGGSGVSVAASAASDGLTAYRQAILSGLSRDAALRAAENAAVNSALASVPGAVDADYRPFVEAALLVLVSQLDAAKVGGSNLPSDASVSEAIRGAIERAGVR